MLPLRVLNLINKPKNLLKTTPAVTAVFVCLFFTVICGFSTLKHPFYIGVTDIKYNSQTQNFHVSVKLFTNDLEGALRKTSGKPIDILNPKNKPEVDSVLAHYIRKHLSINAGTPVSLNYIGYEREEEAIWTYFESPKITAPKTLKIHNTLLYDVIQAQTNIIHVEINGIKKSSKVSNPESNTELSF